MIKYILCMDIGNTNTVLGLFENRPGCEKVKFHWRTVSQRDRTSDELGIFLLGFLKSENIDVNDISDSIYCSVIPSFNPIIERMTRDYFNSQPIRVDSNLELPISISYNRPEEIGTDRLVNASAASVLYGENLIVIDIGTATTFCVIEHNDYKGGSIAPGLKISIDSLSQRTAQLPTIEFKKPVHAIAQSTIEALQSGFFYGWVGLFKEIISRIKQESKMTNCKVIATGGLSRLIMKEEPGLFDIVDPLLTLKGLKIIFDKTRLRSAP